MKINSKADGRRLSHFISNKLALFVFFALGSSLLFGQTRLTGFLNVDGGTHRINQDGTNYIDYVIPQPGAYPYLTFSARGGGGGRLQSLNSLWDNIITAKAFGGQGATATATFKIGTGASELAPGATLRVIVGRGGDNELSTYYGINDIGAGGGGGSGVLYLPGGADGNIPSNWKILLVAGGGGGAAMEYTGLTTKPKVINGMPGQSSEQGDTSYYFVPDPVIVYGHPVAPFSRNGAGGFTYLFYNSVTGHCGGGGGGGGGSTYLTCQQAANGLSWGQGYNDCTGPNTLMGDGSFECKNGKSKQGGKGLFQWVNGKLIPTGGMGGPADQWGGYGFGGGGGGDKGSNSTDGIGGGGGGYSGGSAGGGGGGSYVNSDWAVPNTGWKMRNGLAEGATMGFVDYQFTSAIPVASQGLYLKVDKGTQWVLAVGNWTLKWQYDCNLVLYGPNGVGWASNTNNKATALRFQGDGNLVIYNNGVPVWNSDTPNNHHNGNGGRKLMLTTEGSLFIIDEEGQVIWKGH